MGGDEQDSSGQQKRGLEVLDLSDSQITWISGTMAGFAATFAKQPIQRVKWIQQTESSHRSLASIFHETMHSHGWRGFFGGSLAAVARNVPHSVIVYTLYPHCALACTDLLRTKNETFASRFAAGYLTMVLSTVMTHPLDTLRVRIAVAGGRNETLIGSARAIYAADGLAGFYSGFWATLIGAGPRGAIGFGIFETAKPAMQTVSGLQDKPALAKFLCGYVAGLVAETVVYPLDTVRRRQQAFPVVHAINRTSAFTAMVSITQTEGVLGLFKGIALNIIKNPAATAVSFVVNDFVKDAFGYGRHPRPVARLQELPVSDALEDAAHGKAFQAAAGGHHDDDASSGTSFSKPPEKFLN